MKKSIFAVLSLSLLWTGCMNELNPIQEENGETVKVTVCTELEQAGKSTRAVWDNDGNGACVDHWIMEVYDAQGQLFDRQEKKNQSGLTNSFDITLIKNQSYQFAFWADTKGMYDTKDLREVKTVSKMAGRDKRDAFFAEVDYTSTKNETLTAKLYRPFAQVNVVTLDLAKLYSQMEKAGTTADYDKFIPQTIKLKTSTYNKFNVLTGAVDSVGTYSLNISECYADYSAHADTTTVFMDYGFAAVDKEVRDMKFSFISNGEEISYNFTNIPVKRNYRTNIFGNLLSNDATWTVTVDPIWNQPDFDVDTYTPLYEDLTSAIEDAAAGDMVSINGVSFTKAEDGFCYTDPENEKGRLVYVKSISTPGNSTTSTKFIPNTGGSPVDLQTLLLGSKGRLEGSGSYLKSTDIIALPEGTVYYKNDGSGIVDTYGDITFIGAGEDKTVISAVQTPGNTGYRFFRIYNRYAKCIEENIIYHYNFENLTIDGSGESSASANCFVVTCYNIEMNLKNVTIKNFGGSAFSVWANDALNAAGYSGDWTGFYLGGGNYYPTKAMNCGVEINLESCTVKDNGRLVHYDAAPYVSGNNAGGYGFIHLNYDASCTIDNGEMYDVVSSVKKGEGNCLLNGVDVWPAE